MSSKTHNIYVAGATVAAAVVIGCFASVATTAMTATATTGGRTTSPGLDPTRPWTLSTIIVGGVFLLLFLWIVLGLLTPVWDLPEIREGLSYRKRLVRRRAGNRARKAHAEIRFNRALLDWWRELDWIEEMIREAKRTGTYWSRTIYNPVEYHYDRWTNCRPIFEQHRDLEGHVLIWAEAHAEIGRLVSIAFEHNAGPVCPDDDLDAALDRIATAKGILKPLVPDDVAATGELVVLNIEERSAA